MNGALHPDHLADLQRSGLTADTIKAAGIYTVPPDEIGPGKNQKGLPEGVVSALAFPYPGCGGFERFKVWWDEGRQGKKPKYLQKAGTPNHLYFPPTVDLQGDGPLILGEGEKKILALWQAGFQVVGLGGIWGWCQRAEGYNQPKELWPIADLSLVNWGRPVTILFDSDGHDKPMVRLAAFRLARELSKRGARVSVLFLPAGQNGEKQGADDFLVAQGPAKLREMIP